MPNRPLGKWVHKQREEMKKRLQRENTSMSSCRLLALSKIGFQITTCKRADALWQMRYEELLQFFHKNGHPNVPQLYRENKALGKWYHRQKYEMKKKIDGKPSYLTEYRFQALRNVSC